jgi:hypothetical protein
MEEQRFQRLVVIMASIAGGDRAAVATLYVEFGAQIAATMRSELRRQGVEQVSAEDLDGLVIDACLEVGRVAGSWDPTRGALPWTWARLRLRRIVSGFVGIHTTEFDVDAHDAGRRDDGEPVHAAADARDDAEALAVLSRRGHPLAALLMEAFETLGVSARNQLIVLGYQVQESARDPSPARTIAAQQGLQPDAVRQVVSRTRRKLRQLASADRRFEALAATPLVA